MSGSKSHTTSRSNGHEVRGVRVGDHAGFDTTAFLAHAARQARERRLDDLLIVDANGHHRELATLRESYKYIEDPVLRHRALLSRDGNQALVYRAASNEHVSGRIVEPVRFHLEAAEPGVDLDISVARRRLASTGIDVQVLVPSLLLDLAIHPITDIQVGLSWAYSRWLTEELLPREPRLKTMIYLPLCDPAACVRFVEYFSNAPGVVGFLVSAGYYVPLHHHSFMPVYRALEERGMPLAIHATLESRERLFEGMEVQLSKWAAGLTNSSQVHLANLVVNGIPERFPGLKFLWMGGGLAWIPFMMARLDSGYRMRTSEAPLLQKRPSEYLREMYYTSHPLDVEDRGALSATFDQINAETQLLYASGMPTWDFVLPGVIYDLPFLSATARRNILGQNARALFRLPASHPSSLPPLAGFAGTRAADGIADRGSAHE